MKKTKSVLRSEEWIISVREENTQEKVKNNYLFKYCLKVKVELEVQLISHSD